MNQRLILIVTLIVLTVIALLTQNTRRTQRHPLCHCRARRIPAILTATSSRSQGLSAGNAA